MNRFWQLGSWLRAHDSFTIFLLATVCSMSAAILTARDAYSLLANYLWLASVSAIVFAALRHDRIGVRQLHLVWTKLKWSAKTRELVIIALLSLVALVLRVYDLEHYPLAMNGDEGEIGVLALRVVQGTQPLPLWSIAWLDYPAMLFYFKAISLIVFGTGEVGLRMTSALIGTLGVPLLYWLGRMAWGRVAAVTAAWLMVVSHLAIHYSRSGLNVVEVATGMIGVLLLLALARERTISTSPAALRPNNELSLFVGIGLLMAFSQYVYYSARLIPLVIGLGLLYMWFEKRVSMKQICMVGLASFIMFAPMALFYVNHPGQFMSRTNGVNAFSDANVRHTLGPNASLPASLPALIQHQLEGTIGFLIQRGDTTGFYFQNVPNFDVLTSLLTWLGLGLVLIHARRFYEFILLVWLGLGLFLGGFMSLDPPNAGRLMIVVPSIFLLGSVFVAHAAQFVRAAQLGVIVMLLGGLLILGINAKIYLVDYMPFAPGLAPILIAREMSVSPEQYREYLMGAPNLYVGHGTIRFIARNAQPQDLLNPSDVPPPSPKLGTLVITLPNHLTELKTIQTRFPGGINTSFTDSLGRLVYAAYRIPPTRGD